MHFAIRQSMSSVPPRDGLTDHPCPQCRQAALVLTRRHVSPPRLGTALVTEYYDCNCCDARYKYSPADDLWRPIYQ